MDDKFDGISIEAVGSALDSATKEMYMWQDRYWELKKENERLKNEIKNNKKSRKITGYGSDGRASY